MGFRLPVNYDFGTAEVVPSIRPGRTKESQAEYADAVADRYTGDGPRVCVTIKVKTKNPTNNLRHWRTLSKEANEQKEAATLALLDVPPWRWVQMETGCVVTLTRISAGRLDSDNLRAALKHIKDAVAVKLFGGTLGQRDDDDRATWRYGQILGPRGHYAVIVSIVRRGT